MVEHAAGLGSAPEPNPVALITGAARGIGRASAVGLARLGYHVALVDRRMELLDELCGELTAEGRRAVALNTDLAVPAEIDALIDRCHAAAGSVALLVHCAGVILPKSLAAASADEWDALMAVNLRAVFLLSRMALPDLRARRGAIVTIASTAGLHPQQGNGPYCVSKAAVVMLSRALAQELRPDGVRVNCICPGGVDTPLMADYLEAHGDPETLTRRRRSGLLSQPDEIAEAVLWLASSGARAVTGQVLVVDRGALLAQ